MPDVRVLTLGEVIVGADNQLIYIRTETDRAEQLVGLRMSDEAVPVCRAILEYVGSPHSGWTVARIEELSRTVAEKDQRIRELESRIAGADRWAEQARERIDELENLLGSSRRRNNELRENISQLQADIRTSRARVEAKDGLLSTRSRRINELLGKVEQGEQRAVDLEDALREIRDRAAREVGPS